MPDTIPNASSIFLPWVRQGAAGGLTWFQSTAPDASAALVGLYRRFEEAPRYTPALQVPGLDPARRYRAKLLHRPVVPHSMSTTDLIDRLVAGTLTLTGAQLRDIGLPLPPLPPEEALVVGLRAEQ